jgi:antitoxin MazE
MRVLIRNIGNSRGIIIPAPLLASCGLGDEVELRVDGSRLIVESVQEPRAKWFTDYKPALLDEALLDSIPQDEGEGEWQW